MPKAVTSKMVAPKVNKTATKTVAPKAVAPKMAPHRTAAPKPVAKTTAAKTTAAKATATTPTATAATEPKLTGAAPHAARPERRRNTRFPLGLPVQVVLAGRAEPMTVELADLSITGGRFRCVQPEAIGLDQTATFSFLLPGQKRCQAKGKVIRSDGSGEFVLRLLEANRTFLGFISQLTAG